MCVYSLASIQPLDSCQRRFLHGNVRLTVRALAGEMLFRKLLIHCKLRRKSVLVLVRVKVKGCIDKDDF